MKDKSNDFTIQIKGQGKVTGVGGKLRVAVSVSRLNRLTGGRHYHFFTLTNRFIVITNIKQTILFFSIHNERRSMVGQSLGKENTTTAGKQCVDKLTTGGQPWSHSDKA